VRDAEELHLGFGGSGGVEGEVADSNDALDQGLVELDTAQVADADALLVAGNQAVVARDSVVVDREFPGIAPQGGACEDDNRAEESDDGADDSARPADDGDDDREQDEEDDREERAPIIDPRGAELDV